MPCVKSGMSSTPLHDILSDIDEMAEKDGSVNLKSLLESFENRSFGPVLALLGILAISPLGAVPGIPIVLAGLVILWAGQILIGRSHPWVPSALHSISLKESQVESFQEKAEPAIDHIDNWVKPRFEWAVGTYSEYIIAAMSIALSLIMIPLELIPFAVALPAGGLVLLGLSLMAKDGILTLISMAFGVIVLVGGLLSVI
ncbi:MAG: hypothetical protein CBB65_00680 [Hyphomonadaceae bacterium TMED5]|nr:hypothetical protein [Ponticaulis sp.]OUY01666.1 MAG: hypothetical protein CBB65_00680 [Hyphomonadaceae bacterium TMED5]